VVNLVNYSRPKALANLTHEGEDYKFESKVYRFLFVCVPVYAYRNQNFAVTQGKEQTEAQILYTGLN